MDKRTRWYHGSPHDIRVLREGSTITPWCDLARVFSHKPTLVCISDDLRIRHNGELPGYLYQIDDTVGPDDVIPHPRTTMAPGDEWLTQRALGLRLIGPTEIRSAETLSATDVTELLRHRSQDSCSQE